MNVMKILMVVSLLVQTRKEVLTAHVPTAKCSESTKRHVKMKVIYLDCWKFYASNLNFALIWPIHFSISINKACPHWSYLCFDWRFPIMVICCWVKFWLTIHYFITQTRLLRLMGWCWIIMKRQLVTFASPLYYTSIYGFDFIAALDPCDECSHTCEHEGGQLVRCTCPEGYELAADKRTCIGGWIMLVAHSTCSMLRNRMLWCDT